MAYKLRVTNLQNVAPGNTATLTLACGANAPTLDMINFELTGGMTPAHIERMVVRANGVMIYEELSGTVHNLRDAYRGVFNSPGFLCLDFTEPKARNGAAEQLAGSVPLSLLQNFIVELQIAAAAPAGGRIAAQQVVRAPTRAPYVVKMFNAPSSFAAGGEQVMYLPNAQAGGKMKRLWIHEITTPGTVTGVELRVGNKTVYESLRTQLEQSQKRYGLTPQAGIVVVDFIEDGNLSGVLDTEVTSAPELRLTSSAANAYRVFYELIDPLQKN